MFVTRHTDPDYWPGQNLLGALLMELTQEILTQTDEHSQSGVDNEEVPLADAVMNVDPIADLAQTADAPSAVASKADDLTADDSVASSADVQTVPSEAGVNSLPVHSKVDPKPLEKATGHSSRSRDRNVVGRSERNSVTPSRDRKGKKKETPARTPARTQANKGSNKGTDRTPHVDIKQFFLDAKRKNMETSPEEPYHAQGPRQRTLEATEANLGVT
jgi:hypothetical protein